jgi:hypothetical protein
VRWLLLIGGLCSLSFAASPKLKSTKSTGKVALAKPKTSAKAAPAKSGQEIPSLTQADKICRRDQAWGKLDAVRSRCADLSPSSSAISTYWRLTLSDDPNELRKGFAPATLAKGDVDPRLLLAAGRYHFARGQIREMEDLAEIARKAKLKGAEIDTLKQLAAGK